MSMSNSEKILVVDDDRTFQKVTKALLEEAAYQVDVVDCADAGEQRIRGQNYDLVLTDLVMSGRNGLEFLDFIKKWSPETPVVMITGFASVNSAVEAMKGGAEDYLTKPCSGDELLLKIKRAIEKQKNQQELCRLREEVSNKYTFQNIIGKSQEIQTVFKLVKQVAETDASVFIFGETGTGKELIAKAIHYSSLRKDKPFISVNCAALSETLLESELFGHERGAFTGAMKQKKGRFELADKGTLFLDEVGDIPLSTQVKLLRVVQEKEFERVGGVETIHTDIRIISATNQNLKQLILKGTFREDLFYRLNVMPLELAPLRKRIEDIPLLVQHFLDKHTARLGKTVKSITPAALELLLAYSWPGNVRELENVMERAIILCLGDTIEPQHLTCLFQEKDSQILKDAFQQHLSEEQLIKLYARMILEDQDGNKKAACDILKLNFRTLQSRIKE